MTTSSRRRAVSFVAVALTLAISTAGCGSDHGSGPSESALELDAFQHARVIVTQMELDTGLVHEGDIGPGAVVNGTVVNGAQLNTWYETSGWRLNLPGAAPVTMDEETHKVEDLLRHLPQWQNTADRHNKVPQWTTEQAARAVLVQELVDAAFVSGAVTQGLTDPSDHIIVGPTLDAWYTAHRNDRLPGSSGLTLADEVARIVAAINTPKS